MRRLLTALACCLSATAFADITLVNEAISGGKTRVVTLSAKGNKAWFEIKEADGPPRVMLRDGEAKKLFLIDHTKKRVLAVPDQDDAQVELQQAQLRAQMQAQLSRLPPEQRERMERTMLGMVPPPKGQESTWSFEKKKVPPRKVSGFACQDYTVLRDGRPAGEGCFTTWKDVGFTAEEFKEIMLKALPPTAAGPMTHGMEQQANSPGLPVWRTHLNERGEVSTETTLKSLSKATIPASKFELPRDYPVTSPTRPTPPAMPGK